MVQATELRIGNLLFDRKTNRNFMVTAIHKILDEIHVNSKPLDEIEPIHLTAEILSRSGFEFFRDGWHVKRISNRELSTNLLNICLEEKAYSVSDEINFKEVTFFGLQHLHQLQNLYFTLSGEELAVDL
jgi:hypothetical protein